MTIDLTYLTYTVILALVQVGLQSSAYKWQVGNAYTVGPRDDDLQPSGMVGRFHRAYFNLLESIALFAIVVLVAHVAGRANEWTAIGAQVYFWGRVAYLPAYVIGVPWLRTFIWQISMIGLVIIIYHILF
jgi:uncharacterized MAPEG superfamily protein